MGVIRGAAGTELEKGTVKEVLKPKVCAKVFGGGMGKLQDFGATNSWAYSWWHKPE